MILGTVHGLNNLEPGYTEVQSQMLKNVVKYIFLLHVSTTLRTAVRSIVLSLIS